VNFVKDLRYAARLLWRSPAFTAIAVLTLALGIGANTAVFSVVDAVFFRPLPYPQPQNLAQVVRFWHSKMGSGDQSNVTGRMWELVRDNASLIDAAAVGGSEGVNLAIGGHPFFVHQERVSAGFFRVLGVRPAFGRGFTAEEDRAGGPEATVLSYSLWQRLFHGDPGVVGRSVVIHGTPCTVVGVMPRGFKTHQVADLWGPLRASTTGEGAGSNYEIIARVRPGVSWAAADGQLASVGAQYMRENARFFGEGTRLGIVPLQQGLARDIRGPVYILWTAVGALLLIACINVAGLLFARGIERSRESATRLALGSSRADVLRPFIAESVLLALLGGAAGVALGFVAIQGLARYAEVAFGVTEDIRLDWRVLMATAAIAFITAILSGMSPAMLVTRIDIREALSEAGARGTSGRRTQSARRALVVTEVAIGLVLLIGAGLLVRTFLYLNGENPGFNPRNVVTATAAVHEARYDEPGAVNRLFEESLRRVRTTPGVDSAAVSLTLPYERALNVNIKVTEIPGEPPENGLINLTYVTPEYFRSLRVPLLRGRVFTTADAAHTRPVVIVNEAMVRRFLDGRAPLGLHLNFGDEQREIVGVTGNVLQAAGWGDFGPTGAVPCAYIPAAQTSAEALAMVHTFFQPSWIVRYAGPTSDAAAALQRAIEATDPQLPVSAVRTMYDVKATQFAEQRFRAAMLSVMAGLALILAATGIYGLISRSVAERTREVGIRMAFGASRTDAVRTVATPGIGLTAIGLAAGLVLAYFASSILRHIVFGISSLDPLTFVVASATLLGVAIVASVIPALRLARLNPADALRHE